MTDDGAIVLDTVEAVFGGRSVRFGLAKDARSIASLEAAIGSPLAAFARFKASAWTLKDVRAVLAHAYPGARLLHGLTHVEAVDAALARRPAVTYSVLAIKVLDAFLFGLEANAASFDEEHPFG